jgi:hypothetical protein
MIGSHVVLAAPPKPTTEKPQPHRGQGRRVQPPAPRKTSPTIKQPTLFGAEETISTDSWCYPPTILPVASTLISARR